MINRLIKYFLDNKLVTIILLAILVTWGIITAPFGWEIAGIPSDPVPVDAIPDIGENQQIVFTEWKGRSPQDIEDQISYPLTTSLLGIPGVKSIRSSSVFGFSSIYIIFNEDIDFYWSRSRILEKLNSLPNGLIPKEAQPVLGPDATSLGQVFWYTIEGRDTLGNPTGGWDLHEIRTVQDFYVKYGLNATDGVSEVASIGGFVQEYQVDVNPDALKAYGISLHTVMKAVQRSNRDVGAKTIEINMAEYLIRGLGYVRSVNDLEKAVVKVTDNVPVTVKDIGRVSLGPATRRGLLDKEGAEVVGGVVVARYGANPLEVINNVKNKIKEISPGLPKRKLQDGRISQLTIVPFYDRTELIYETLGTLEEALSLEILITIIVIIIMVLNVRASIIISGLLPISVLMVFIAMRYFHVDANIVALSGIAIAIGTMVDLGIVLSENIIKHIKESNSSMSVKTIVYNASSEVSSAIITAVATTVVSFIPVFTMQAAEGKLFRPLAFTKTFALVAALIVALFILPTIANWIFGIKTKKTRKSFAWNVFVAIAGLIVSFTVSVPAGVALMLLSAAWFVREYSPVQNRATKNAHLFVVLLYTIYLLAQYWMPLGVESSFVVNYLFIAALLFVILGGFYLLESGYERILTWCLDNRVKFLTIPSIVIVFGLTIWLGINSTLGWIPQVGDWIGLEIEETNFWKKSVNAFPGIGKEFMPSLDEGSFLLMPTSMPHSGMAQNKKVVQQLDMLLKSIPEVDLAVGKLGRVESALDPAPISMYENIINYKPEYIVNKKGRRQRFRVNEAGDYVLNNGQAMSHEAMLKEKTDPSLLIPDENGQYFRNWRQHIRSQDDIWKEIVSVSKIPGVTSAPKLQPIETRLVMLQTGMRAPMGIKVFGPDLETIEKFGMQVESILKGVESVKEEAVFADRIVGKPYIHLNIKRDQIARYGLTIEDVQQTIETAIGGMQISSTVEGRERFPIRVRYPRELRDNPESIANILLSSSQGQQIPLIDLVDIEYVRGPQVIKSENTFLVGYVLFDKKSGFAEVDVVEDAQKALESKINSGELTVPNGVSYKFSGSYENQIRAEKRLSIIVPLVLVVIFLILYFQFSSIATSLMIFSGIAMAFSGGFVVLWLYGQDWFLNFEILNVHLQNLFQIKPINLSVAVWVGFIALFGIATDDGVLMGTYLDQNMKKEKTKDNEALKSTVIEAGKRRIKPAVMTSATTIIALLPILTSTGRGSDIMIPMAIPAFGGMLVAAITYFIVPVLYYMYQRLQLNKEDRS